jgi:prepilin-type N-terminal cleavage/methylation domain-containing protein
MMTLLRSRLARLRSDARRRDRSRLRQAGMTLLEIMIVLAILVLVMGFLVGPRVWNAFNESKEDTQRAVVKQWADAYVMWARRNTGCPKSLDDLAQYVNKKDTNDVWGRPLQFFCGDSLPATARSLGFAVMSVGQDGQPNTADDLKSWE